MSKMDIEDLYWSDLEELDKDENKRKEVFFYLEDYENRDIDELSQIVRLYSNPSGVLTDEFANLIANFYKKDKIKFMKALHLSKDEIAYLVYVFRNLKVFEGDDEGATEEKEIIDSNKLSDEELETVDEFFKMYKMICTS